MYKILSDFLAFYSFRPLCGHYPSDMCTSVNAGSCKTSITNNKKKKKCKKKIFYHLTESHLVHIIVYIYLHSSRYYDIYCDLIL